MDPLPALSVGSLPAITACPRRLARWLHPDDRPAPARFDAPFRLGNAVSQAIRTAHELLAAETDPFGPDLDALLDRRPPPGLATEEEARFGEAIDHYAEAFGDRPGRLHPSCGDTVELASTRVPLRLTARPDLLFVGDDGIVQWRRVLLRRRPWVTRPAESGAERLDPAAALATALRVGELRVVELWTVGGAQMAERVVGRGELAAFRSALHGRVEEARAHPDATSPGWWCIGCPSLRSCPAIPQSSPVDTLGSLVVATP